MLRGSLNLTQVGRVTEIWRFPVSSIGAERLENAVVGPDPMIALLGFMMVSAGHAQIGVAGLLDRS
jgi:uncharacterized protein YcbX